jgi:hypothetical protein
VRFAKCRHYERGAGSVTNLASQKHGDLEDDLGRLVARGVGITLPVVRMLPVRPGRLLVQLSALWKRIRAFPAAMNLTREQDGWTQ